MAQRRESTMNDIYSMIETVGTARTYSSDRHDDIAKSLIGKTSEIIVAVGGYRLVITMAGDLLIGIRPKAISAGRGSLYIDPKSAEGEGFCLRPYPVGHKYEHVSYYHDYLGPIRLQQALVIVTAGVISADCDPDRLYAALGRSGHCAICGETLTDDLSMARGIGPVCWGRIYGKDVLRKVQARKIANAAVLAQAERLF
jgi:hypothetical protein